MRRRVIFSLSLVSHALCMSMLILPFFSRTGRDHWHLTFETGSPVAQINWDLTLCTSLRFGFTSSVGRNWCYRQLIIPYLLAAALFAVLPMVWLRRVLQSTRLIRAGLCPFCGYDLRATPKRCPECGKTPRPAEDRM